MKRVNNAINVEEGNDYPKNNFYEGNVPSIV